MQRNEQSEDLILKKKIQAFKTIYRAIHETNAQVYDNDFLVGKEYLPLQEYEKILEAHCQIKKSKKDKIYSHAYQAWQLAKVHYDNCREDNEKLFNAIYKCICMTELPRYRVVRYLKKKSKSAPEIPAVKKPSLLSKLNFFKKKEEPETIEMDELESRVRVESFDVDGLIEGKNLTLQEIENKKQNSEVIFSIYYHLANPIPPGEIWPCPRAELRF